ncbi:hypothetical protein ANN_27032 [Periplaneta americana]|uniref:Uncharacterized protein n=1 Tax=Periplaneta americana TaxID=6978 RepID=A0ABQ8RWW9_PERAM|nr:hypothetical protein ANN_27032 [Periplaneta americana]
MNLQVLQKPFFKVCHGSLYAVMWLADEPREFNLPTLPQRCITYEAEKLPSKYGVHSEEYVPIRTAHIRHKTVNCTKVLSVSRIRAGNPSYPIPASSVCRQIRVYYGMEIGRNVIV